jgi:hypothetical protein
MKLNKTIILIVLIVISIGVFSQEGTYDKYYKKTLTQANQEYSYENYFIALPLYRQLYEIDSLNYEVNYKMATCLFLTKRNKVQSERYFEYSKEKYIDSYFYLARIYFFKEKFNQSLDAFKYYKNSEGIKSYNNNIVDYYVNKVINAKEFMSKPITAEVINMGDKINSVYPDYAPLLTADESKVYFTSRRPNKFNKEKDPNNELYEDIYYSYNKDSEWTKAINIGPPSNSPTHDAGVSISNDGNILFIYRTSKDLSGGDIYMSNKVDGKFLPPVILPEVVNSEEGVESCATLSQDQKTLYFSSNRDGGFGGKDIYKVVKLPNGEWSKATNLGSKINTPYDEDSPYLHIDGRTMYFSSRGLQNMGGYDVFVSSLDEDGKWESPTNLGYPINTINDDIFFVMNAEGNTGYFSSNRNGGMGASDIYKIKMPLKYNENMLLKGKVTDENTGKSVRSTITIVDFDTKEVQGIYKTNSETGKFIMVLLPKKHYKLIIEAENYESYVDDIDMIKKLSMEDLFKNIKLKKK